MSKQFTSAALTTAVFLATSVVSASAGTIFSGSTNGTLTDPGPNACTYSTSGGQGIAWGEGGSCPDYTGSDEHSRLWIKDFDFNTEISGHEHVQIGEIWWRNEPNPSSKTYNFSSDLMLYLNLSDPTALSASEKMLVKVDNTANPQGDYIVSYRWDDFGLATGTMLSSTLRLDGFNLKLIGNTHGESLTESAYGSGTKFTWYNKEENWSTLGIYADVSYVAPVPLPAAGWMLLAGIGGLFAAKRRKAA